MKPSDIFRFKRFTVLQQKSAMKTGTDGVLLGAWCGHKSAPENILDVGAGTGIISLMLAQRFDNARVTGLEIDHDAFTECAENFRNSPWSPRLTAIEDDFRNNALSGDRFDLIVSNPPFFKNGIKAPDKSRATARHTDSLSAEEVLRTGAGLLKPGGRIALVTPAESEPDLIFEATMCGLSPCRLTEVQSVEDKKPVRLLSEFTNGKDVVMARDTLTIRHTDNRYTDRYISLTKEFYLQF